MWVVGWKGWRRWPGLGDGFQRNEGDIGRNIVGKRVVKLMAKLEWGCHVSYLSCVRNLGFYRGNFLILPSKVFTKHYIIRKPQGKLKNLLSPFYLSFLGTIEIKRQLFHLLYHFYSIWFISTMGNCWVWRPQSGSLPYEHPMK